MLAEIVLFRIEAIRETARLSNRYEWVASVAARKAVSITNICEYSKELIISAVVPSLRTHATLFPFVWNHRLSECPLASYALLYSKMNVAAHYRTSVKMGSTGWVGTAEP